MVDWGCVNCGRKTQSSCLFCSHACRKEYEMKKPHFPRQPRDADCWDRAADFAFNEFRHEKWMRKT